MDDSSMFMWNVSSISPQAGRADPIDDRDRVGGQVEDAGLEAVQRLDPQHDAVVRGMRRQAPVN